MSKSNGLESPDRETVNGSRSGSVTINGSPTGCPAAVFSSTDLLVVADGKDGALLSASTAEEALSALFPAPCPSV